MRDGKQKKIQRRKYIRDRPNLEKNIEEKMYERQTESRKKNRRENV